MADSDPSVSQANLDHLHALERPQRLIDVPHTGSARHPLHQEHSLSSLTHDRFLSRERHVAHFDEET